MSTDKKKKSEPEGEPKKRPEDVSEAQLDDVAGGRGVQQPGKGLPAPPSWWRDGWREK